MREQSNNRRYLIPDPKTDKFFLNAVVLPWHSSGMANEFSEFTKQRNNKTAKKKWRSLQNREHYETANNEDNGELTSE